MDQEMEQQMRDVLAKERFGVLATLFSGRLHTATIHFAETDDLELVHAIRRDTLKAEQAAANPRVAFQVDNRGILMESRDRFARISIEGRLHHVPEDDPEYEVYRRTFAQKLPIGDRLLAHPEIALYVLRPSVIRLAIGAAAAEDITVTYVVDDAPQPEDNAVWRDPSDDTDLSVIREPARDNAPDSG
jgi:nitroimidazol reductase NimA-like FMN-containing flavoprotein (pyridoxamine 5'-phosphate oxidase superfamily)